MRTYTPKADEIDRTWWVVDATGKPLGRLATEVARVLRGKHKPIFTPHLDTGDHVVVLNASKVALTVPDPVNNVIGPALVPAEASVNVMLQLPLGVPASVRDAFHDGPLP